MCGKPCNGFLLKYLYSHVMDVKVFWHSIISSAIFLLDQVTPQQGQALFYLLKPSDKTAIKYKCYVMNEQFCHMIKSHKAEQSPGLGSSVARIQRYYSPVHPLLCVYFKSALGRDQRHIEMPGI